MNATKVQRASGGFPEGLLILRETDRAGAISAAKAEGKPFAPLSKAKEIGAKNWYWISHEGISDFMKEGESFYIKDNDSFRAVSPEEYRASDPSLCLFIHREAAKLISEGRGPLILTVGKNLWGKEHLCISAPKTFNTAQPVLLKTELREIQRK